MDATSAGLVGAIIGAIAVLANSVFNGRSQRQLEKIKADWSARSNVDNEFRAHVAMVARELMSAQHSMEWLCAHTDGGAQLDRKSVSTYHAEVHASFPRLLGALASVSTLDANAHRELFALAEKVFAVDAALAAALAGFRTSPTTASELVAAQRATATRLYRELPISIGRITADLKNQGVRPA